MSDRVRRVRTRRGKLTHFTWDLRVTFCGRGSDGWILQSDDEPVTCSACERETLN